MNQNWELKMKDTPKTLTFELVKSTNPPTHRRQRQTDSLSDRQSHAANNIVMVRCAFLIWWVFDFWFKTFRCFATTNFPGGSQEVATEKTSHPLKTRHQITHWNENSLNK